MVLSELESLPQTERESQGDKQSKRQKGKYGDLLKPVKNLSQSWGIDIAKELSDYALSLGITLDCDISSLVDDDEGLRVDFTEAALLLQGSASIYCRKVEHLYTLVLAAVDAANVVKSRNSKSSLDSSCDGENGDEDNAIWNVDDIDFLKLDDVIPIADEKQISVRESSATTLQNRAHDPTLLVEVPPLLRVPTNGGANVNGNGILRMNLGTMDESGALMLYGAMETNIAMCDLEDDVNACTPSKIDSPHNIFADEDDDIASSGLSPELLRQASSPLPFHMDDNMPSLGLSENVHTALPQRPWDVVVMETFEKQPVELKKANLFEELDPHNDMGLQPRPAGKKSTVSRPRSRKSTCWTATWCKPEKVNGDIKVEDQLSLADRVLGALPRGSNLRRHVTYGALRAPAAKVARKIATAKRMRASTGGGLLTCANAASAQAAVDEGILDDIFEGDMAEDDFNDNFENEIAGTDSEPLMSLGFEDDDVLDLPSSDPLFDSKLGLGADCALQEIVNGYQQKCLQYMRKTSVLWEKQAINADLRERVEKWSARIRPKLEEQDKRPVFDIQTCGSDVIRRLQNIEESEKTEDGEDFVVEMKTALEATDQYDVCRLFLATLQLANNHDVEIRQENGSAQLKLLDSERVAQVRRPPLALITPLQERRSESVLNIRSVNMFEHRKSIDIKPSELNFADAPPKSGSKRGRRSVGVSTPGRRRVRARTYMR